MIGWALMARPGSKVAHLVSVGRSIVTVLDDERRRANVQCGRDIEFDYRSAAEHPYVPSTRHGDVRICRDCVKNLRSMIGHLSDVLAECEEHNR